jgi:hypothetical protein
MGNPKLLRPNGLLQVDSVGQKEDPRKRSATRRASSQADRRYLMFGKLFGERPTTRFDVALAISGALLGAFKAWDTTQKYKAEQKAAINKENQK